MYVEEIKDLKQQLALLEVTCRNKDHAIQELMAKGTVLSFPFPFGAS